jgi:3-oxoacyl-[acyl-carrier-protein] synthase II
MSGISPLGTGWQETYQSLKQYKNKTVKIEDWDQYRDLQTKLACPIPDFKAPKHYRRVKIRGMGKVSLMSTRSSELALEDAGLLEDDQIKDGSMGIAFGSSSGSPTALAPFAKMRMEGCMKGITATSYIQMMSHTCAVNVGLFFELKGRVIPTCSACTSGSMAIGYAYEAIKHGYQTMMIAGGAEELCVTEAATFDVLYATSTNNDHPNQTPSPFDIKRDGLVVGEGAGSLVLEELEHAQARGATIYAEIIGFGTNSDGAHITNPSSQTMQVAMQKAVDDAGIHPDQIGYVNAHATATSNGDIAESQATASLFKKPVPISSLKSYFGHTLGASGSLESWITIMMMLKGEFAPTINLDKIDPECGELDYIQGQFRQIDTDTVMNNNFAFGGINTSLIFKRWGL